MRTAGVHDFEAVRAMHGRCSAESRVRRYWTSAPEFSRTNWHRLAEPERGVAVVAHDDDRIVAMANILYLDTAGQAEIAFLVEDAWQSRGVGTGLARQALDRCRADGLDTVFAWVCVTNTRMHRLMRSLGADHRALGEGESEFMYDLT
ncbi:GNAT family N-acetyltransferase [Streptomyces griseoviridis]|nr:MULTISPECIES: GNAT family N-acetyltransferase [Streptomyces]MDH6701764.1 RimJ/RimL family protein N-acetyltransferase [Streptomyces sp. MAA16]